MPSLASTMHDSRRVTIRNGKTIAANDYIYLSAAWAPGAGEPYTIARVMEFVTASSSRSGAAALASSEGTLQVRANVFLRMRDISARTTNDPRLLVATMHSDVFNLDNVRGICDVRHRELIGNGTAPQVSQWKKKDDHFYFYQLYDRYIHRFYDVIPTEKLKNAPPEVLAVLKQRYSFVVAEVGMMADLCDALRGCNVCHRWAASAESVRCDTCKGFFHMKCLNPPLASKPAKGYSWTCAPCSRRHEQDVGLALATGGTVSSTSSSSNGHSLVRAASLSGTITPSRGGARGGSSAAAGRGRGRGGGVMSARRALAGQEDGGISDMSPDGSPAPTEKTLDDARGTRCFMRWPYRYFGQHSNALDVLDPHDSVYPIAATRLGAKYQALLPTWEEQKAAGLGTHFRAKGAKEDEAEEQVQTTASSRKKPGRPPKRKRGDPIERADTPTTGASTPIVMPAALPSEPPEFERGTETSAEPIFLPSVAESEQMVDAYIKSAQNFYKTIEDHNVDLLNRALQVFTMKEGKPVAALAALTESTPAELRIVNWTPKEQRLFDQAVQETSCNSDMKQLKKRIPTKRVADIVRYFVVWKTQRLKEELEAQRKEGKAKSSGSASGPPRPSTSRAVSPSLSIFGGDEAAAAARTCCLCSATSSEVWYKGPTSWSNRTLCTTCGVHWRKYAAESSNPDLLSVITRNKAAAVANASAETLGLVAPSKARGKNAPTSSPPAAPAVKPPDPPKCVLCRRVEPRTTLVGCQQCSLSVHAACFGVTEEEARSQEWMCDACTNERDLDAALVPHCVLCSKAAQEEAIKPSPAPSGGRGRPKLTLTHNEASKKKEAPLTAMEAFKPTECNNWTHVLCSLFMPDVSYSDPLRYKLAEGCGSLPVWRYEATCHLCADKAGACVTCAEPSCRKTFHVSCGINHGFAAGLEMSTSKALRKVTFKGETAAMNAVLYCKDHHKASRKLIDLADADPATGRTAAQVYAHNYKAVSDATYALLRRARRLDTVQPVVQVKRREKQCGVCSTVHSPFWWHFGKNEAEEWTATPLTCCNRCRPKLISSDSN